MHYSLGTLPIFLAVVLAFGGGELGLKIQSDHVQADMSARLILNLKIQLETTTYSSSL